MTEEFKGSMMLAKRLSPPLGNPFMLLTVEHGGRHYRCRPIADDAKGKNARVKCGYCGFGVLYYAEYHELKPLDACRRCGARVVGIGLRASR